MADVILAGDIGGTKTHLGLFRVAERELHPIRDFVYQTSAFASLEDATRGFLRPDDRITGACFGVPGPVIDGVSHATNVVEHPELVAERLVRLARLVGRENVLGGTDCGFAQSPHVKRVHPSIMWAKLEALAEGARLASRELWS